MASVAGGVFLVAGCQSATDETVILRIDAYESRSDGSLEVTVSGECEYDLSIVVLEETTTDVELSVTGTNGRRCSESDVATVSTGTVHLDSPLAERTVTDASCAACPPPVSVRSVGS